MIYIYDILLNFQKDIYDYYEWKKDDVIRHIKKIKLFKITSTQIEDFFNNDIIIDKTFLDNIYKTTEIYHKDSIDYASLFTDGYRSLAIMFNNNGKSLYKSRLLLEEDEEVLDVSRRLKNVDISYRKIKSRKFMFYTRSEKEIRDYLLKEIKKLYKQKKSDFLQYLYLEYFDKTVTDDDIVYKKLIDSLNSINDKHKQLVEILRLAHRKKSKS